MEEAGCEDNTGTISPEGKDATGRGKFDSQSGIIIIIIMNILGT